MTFLPTGRDFSQYFEICVNFINFVYLVEQPYQPPGLEPSHPGSLREQMLKPDTDKFQETTNSRQLLNSSKMSPDENRGNLQLLLPQLKNDGLHYSFRYFHLFNFSRNQLSTFTFLLGLQPTLLKGIRMACLLLNQQVKIERVVNEK